MLVLLLPASESSCLWSLHCKWVQSECSLWPALGCIYPTPPPLLQVGVCAWMEYWSEWDSTKTGGVCGGDVFVCVRACVPKCESDYVSARRREGAWREGRDLCRRQRQTIMNTKLRRYQRRAKGTGKRINEIGVQPRGRHKEMNCPHINTNATQDFVCANAGHWKIRFWKTWLYNNKYYINYIMTFNII